MENNATTVSPQAAAKRGKARTFKIQVLSKKTNDVLETRKFTLKAPTIDALYDALALPGSLLLYKDSANDTISVRTDLDLQELIRSGPNVDGVLVMFTFKVPAGAIERGMNSAAATVKPVATKVAEATKKAAEEAIVLGVRAYSLGEHSWKNRNNSGPVMTASPLPDGVVLESGPAVVEVSKLDNDNSNNATTAGSPNTNNADENSLKSKIGKGLSSVGTEALVLGVRAVSYIESLAAPNPPNPAAPPAAADEALTNSWVNVNTPPLEVPANASAPSGPLPPVTDFDRKLNDLAAMGFTDRTKSEELLRANNGDLEAVVMHYLNAPQ